MDSMELHITLCYQFKSNDKLFLHETISNRAHFIRKSLKNKNVKKITQL